MKNKQTFLTLMMTLLLAVFVLPACAGKGLSRKQSDEVRSQVIAEWMEQTHSKYAPMFDSKRDSDLRVSSTEAEMPFWFTVYGDASHGERSLWISLHGGGGAPHSVNDQQWGNQKRLYQPEEGVYVAPRAPWDAWDMWCQAPIDSLYEKLIQVMVACQGVNPDKVYLMGYSAGGDGVWRMAPRMADHWAAASMMAGHPGDVSLVNLRNLPFMIWCGALDAAYDRNKMCTQRGAEMDSLQADCPEGYRHKTYIMEGKGHWMDREDRAALPWMRQYVRNPYPKAIVWQQEEVLRPAFYWLSVSPEEMVRGKQVRLSVEGNTILLTRCDYSRLTLCLCDELVNLDKPVTVMMNGKQLFKGRVPRTEKCMSKTMAERGDPRYCFPACLELKMP